MRVTHLLGALRASGMERMLASAADHFTAEGLESSVIGQGQDHPFAPVLEQRGYSVLQIDGLKSPAHWRQYTAALRSLRPDVLHIHTEGQYVPAVLLARQLRIPTIRTVHNVFRQESLRRVKRIARSRIADKFVYAVVAPSMDVAENERSYGRQVQIIPNWVDDEYMSIDRRPEKNSALIVGNCSHIKNHEFILEMLEDLGFTVFHHGDETHASTEERTILGRLQRSGRLAYRGTDSPTKSLSRAEMYVMPSTQEGMPVALLEAITAGIPAVVAQSPGMKWARSEENVRLISLTDRPAWIRALRDRPVAPAFDAHRHRKQFSAAEGSKSYSRLYHSALERAVT